MTANEAWIMTLAHVLHLGHTESPRGKTTKELINQSFKFDMRYPVCWHPKRKLSYTFMAAEAYWITSGSMFVDDIEPYNKHIAQFSDDGYIFNGAYGPKVINQINYVVNTLRKDPNSRQAIMSIWVHNPISSKDIACTLTLQFLIRRNKIHTIVNMRSNDLWLGRPYDMFNFTVITLRILTYLNEDYYDTFNELIELGDMYFNVGSSHLYEENFESAKAVIDENPNYDPIQVPIFAINDWKYVVDSLLACRDQKDATGLWIIRP